MSKNPQKFSWEDAFSELSVDVEEMLANDQITQDTHDRIIHPMAEKFVEFIATMEPEEFPEIPIYAHQLISCVAKELLFQIFDEWFGTDYHTIWEKTGEHPDSEEGIRTKLTSALSICTMAGWAVCAHDFEQGGGWPENLPKSLWKLDE